MKDLPLRYGQLASSTSNIWPAKYSAENDTNYNIKFSSGEPYHNNTSGILSIKIDKGSIVYYANSHSFSFIPKEGSWRVATSSEIESFKTNAPRIFSNKLEAKELLDSMNKDAKKIESSYISPIKYEYNDYEEISHLYFEIPDKNIRVAFIEGYGQSNLKIARYKSRYRKTEDYTEISKENMGESITVSGFKGYIPMWEKITDKKDQQFCEMEILEYIPKLLENLDSKDKNFKEKKAMLINLQKNLQQK